MQTKTISQNAQYIAVNLQIPSNAIQKTSETTEEYAKECNQLIQVYRENLQNKISN